MPRPREYDSNAERQAAYRARHPERRPERQSELAALARDLHWALLRSAAAGTCPLPDELLGENAEETLRNLVFFVRGQAPAE